MKRRVLVCGGRDYSSKDHVFQTLDALKPDEVVHGAAAGADYLAGLWARERNVLCIEFPAEWKKRGRMAGSARNEQMLVEGKPTLVVAFPGGKGTRDMVDRAHRWGVPVVRAEPNYVREP